uniref:Uncharacterized protein n=1 Tax=Timema bartmani TaxID=61472 RepID=A0A7R9EZ86_9NEOP|nr:unnamed protein product [Timema bartmani]
MNVPRGCGEAGRAVLVRRADVTHALCTQALSQSSVSEGDATLEGGREGRMDCRGVFRWRRLVDFLIAVSGALGLQVEWGDEHRALCLQGLHPLAPPIMGSSDHAGPGVASTLAGPITGPDLKEQMPEQYHVVNKERASSAKVPPMDMSGLSLREGMCGEGGPEHWAQLWIPRVVLKSSLGIMAVACDYNDNGVLFTRLVSSQCCSV